MQIDEYRKQSEGLMFNNIETKSDLFKQFDDKADVWKTNTDS